MNTEFVDKRVMRMTEMARAHIEAGGMNSAGVYYRMILKDTAPPQSSIQRIARGEACMWYARKSIIERRLGTATDWFRQALDADPRSVDYRLEMCRDALIPMDMVKTARIHAEMCTKIEPNHGEAWGTLGMMEATLGNTNAAIAAFEKRLEIEPDNPISRLDRATVALDTADYSTVRKMVTGIKGKYEGDAINFLAMAAYREGNHEESIRLYDEAVAAGVQDPELAKWNKSLPLHSLGRYKEGWECHEARGTQKTDGPMRIVMNRFLRPMWNWEPPPARIHLHQEMGFGDLIAMLRYIPKLLEMGYDLSLEVNTSMIDLVQRSFPKVRVMSRAIDYPGAIGLQPFDYHIPMLSLPYIFKTDIDTVPWYGPYLTPSPGLVFEYGKKVWANSIGLCWSSGIRKDGTWISEYGRRKSIPAIYYPQLAFGVNTVSLQVGPERGEINALDVLPPVPTWDDTAALIANLDLVITVDTSVAHLAGALGKPVWLMMHTEGSWHWMSKRLDSPWYPTARLFRQEQPYVWDSVIDKIKQELKDKWPSLLSGQFKTPLSMAAT